VKKFTSNFLSWLKVFGGWGGWLLVSWAFVNLLYPVFIQNAGALVGTAFATLLSTAVCWTLLEKIISKGADWLKLEVVSNQTQKILAWVLGRGGEELLIQKFIFCFLGPAIIFLTVSFFFDPMIATLFFRKGDVKKPLSKNDKLIFAWSALLCNIIWLVRSFGTIQVYEYLSR
jgi:hypothetical protein